MTNSFFPKTDAALVVWATNYKEKISANATALNLTPEQATAEINYCAALIEAINAVDNQKKALKAIVDLKKKAIQMQGGALRVEISRHKMALGYTESIGQDLGIVSGNVGFDTNAYKPKLTTEMFGGYIRIKYKKNGADGINIYHRKKGTSNWVFLTRTTKSPFDYNITLATEGQPEHWEYRAFGVIDDAEIGQASDIVEVVYGG
jgi:hypothetical protein